LHQRTIIQNGGDKAREAASKDGNSKEKLTPEIIVVKIRIEKLPVLVSFIKSLNEIFRSMLFYALILDDRPEVEKT